MRDRLFILAFFLLLSALLPPLTKSRAEEKPAVSLPDSFSILLTETGTLYPVTPEEYLVGCLAAQIPIDYEQEALNAQAAASYTYALRLLGNAAALPDGALLSDDGKTAQPFFTPEKCAELYGTSYDAYLPRLKEAAAYGASHPITYEGKPIYAVYHSVSAGRTASPYGIWGLELPYLVPAESGADKNYINYECDNEMTVESARLALVAAQSDIVTPADYGKWFSEMNRNEDGYVISVKIGNNLFSGGDVWRIFGLRSTAFEVSYRNGIFTFHTKGYGHGAGLSQYGANEMAKEGKTAEEILKHYYTGVKIG